MTLNDPFFTKFDGSPDLGRVPVRLVVNGRGMLTQNQMAGVEHAYHQFRSAYRLSVADFHPAVRQAAIMTDTDSKRVTFKFGKGKLTLLAQGATAGRSKVEMPLAHDGKPIDVTISVGAALLVPGEKTRTVLQRADNALLVAKSEGRNRVVVAEALAEQDDDGNGGVVGE